MKDEKEEKSMEEKDISRRDFMKKTAQYATAGAVLGALAGVEGMNPPDAEAEWGDFILFMQNAQKSSDLTLGFAGVVIDTNTTPAILSDWFRTGGREYKVSLSECDRILAICRDMEPIPGFAHRNDTHHPSAIEAIAAKDIPTSQNPGPVPLTY